MNATSLQLIAFNLFIAISYIVYFVSLVGIKTRAPEYLSNLDSYVKIYVSIFLLWRFNMFRRVQFTELDRKIVFSSAIFLLSTTALNQWVSHPKTTVSSILHPLLQSTIS